MNLYDAKDMVERAYRLLPSKLVGDLATIEMLSIGLQESGFKTRRQLITKVVDGEKKLVPEGPAASFWQFEQGGGVKGVMQHHSSTKLASAVCSGLGIPFDAKAIWEAMETNDLLGACFARLLLFTYPKPLPAATDTDGAWLYYQRNWRPGKPHPETWAGYHAQAVKAVLG